MSIRSNRALWRARQQRVRALRQWLSRFIITGHAPALSVDADSTIESWLQREYLLGMAAQRKKDRS